MRRAGQDDDASLPLIERRLPPFREQACAGQHLVAMLDPYVRTLHLHHCRLLEHLFDSRECAARPVTPLAP